MRPVEADWIRSTLLALGSAQVSPVANLGSSTHQFRTVRKPHIEERLMRPLRDAGIEIVHVDMKAEDGVDIVGDLNDPALIAELRARGFRALICSNMLEHVADPAVIARACESIVDPAGYVIVTVPKVYPWHPDPIDTMFRPAPDEVAQLFPGCELISSRVFVDGTQLTDEWRKGPLSFLLYPVRLVWHLAGVRRRPDIARAARSRLRSFFRPIEISAVALRRRAE